MSRLVLYGFHFSVIGLYAYRHKFCHLAGFKSGSPQFANVLFNFRKHQWMKLSQKTPFTFLPLPSLSDLGVNFKDACRRLWRVLVTEGSFGGLTPSKCNHCREFTCVASCIEERSSTPKVSIDIGGKITWLVTPGFALKVRR